ncbi:hypothetical protein NM208_g12842 [Fusarium decemcellulare]|uniref:Uncharacterized protein n=1 Tax=Fusarium decemcellulare TaxID=57161 RepID=A0ACC1RNU7_9HYPO|nr:hypothetical protein NM208_g12842 [Fusarium decemcellulare]
MLTGHFTPDLGCELVPELGQGPGPGQGQLGWSPATARRAACKWELVYMFTKFSNKSWSGTDLYEREARLRHRVLTYKANPWPKTLPLTCVNAPSSLLHSCPPAPPSPLTCQVTATRTVHRKAPPTALQKFPISTCGEPSSAHPLPPQLRPAFGLLKGTASTTASAAVSFVSDKDFSLCKPSHIINAIPPPAARLDAA